MVLYLNRTSTFDANTVTVEQNSAAVHKGRAVAHKPIYWPYINPQYFVGLLWHRPGVLQSGGKRSDGGQRTVALFGFSGPLRSLLVPLLLYSLLQYRVFSCDLQERHRKSRLQPKRVWNPEPELVKLISLRERSQQSWNGLSKEKMNYFFLQDVVYGGYRH